MKSFNPKAGHSCAFTSRQSISSSSAIVSKKWFHSRIFAPFAFILLLCGACFQNAHAQNITYVNLSEFTHSLTFDRMSGDSMVFVFNLGSQNDPAESVAGFEVDVEFTSLNSAPDESGTNLSQSWVAEVAAQAQTTYQSQKLTFTYLRADEQGQTGYGNAAEIYLIREGGFDWSETMVSAAVGLVMVDNAELKTAPFSTSSNPMGGVADIYPNPATDVLHVQPSASGGFDCTLINVQGTKVSNAHSESPLALDVSVLPAGMYVLRVSSAAGITEKKILIQ